MKTKQFSNNKYCFFRPKTHRSDIRFTLYSLGFIVSAIFLAATLAAGWLLPASHHVLHWRCQTHHVACLMVGDIFMAIIQLAGNSLKGVLCNAFGESMKILLPFLIHIFFLNPSYFSFFDNAPSSSPFSIFSFLVYSFASFENSDVPTR